MYYESILFTQPIKKIDKMNRFLRVRIDSALALPQHGEEWLSLQFEQIRSHSFLVPCLVKECNGGGVF